MGTTGSSPVVVASGGGENKTPAGSGAVAQPSEYTAQQIRALVLRGLKPDMALLPYQMPRMHVTNSLTHSTKQSADNMNAVRE
jgi:hypothetical protein